MLPMGNTFFLAGNGTCSGHSCGDGVCIPTDYVCDDYLDCRDASDEANCTSTTFQNTFYPRQLPSRCPNSTSLIGTCVYIQRWIKISYCNCACGWVYVLHCTVHDMSGHLLLVRLSIVWTGATIFILVRVDSSRTVLEHHMHAFPRDLACVLS